MARETARTVFLEAERVKMFRTRRLAKTFAAFERTILVGDAVQTGEIGIEMEWPTINSKSCVIVYTSVHEI
jgi:hypothetical protein